MVKRYLIFGVIVVALIVIAIIAALALSHGGKSPKSTGTSSTTQQVAVPAQPSPTASAISDGTYLVGTDIPAGKYKGIVTGSTGYWQISSDANGSNIIANDNVTGPFYVQARAGQYLELRGVKITEVATASASASGAVSSAPGAVARSGVASTLNIYFAAINARHFSTAWRQLTPRLEQSISVAHLASTDTTTRDTAVVIHRVTALDAKTVVAFVTFTSTQAASLGPNGDTRDNWTLDYTMKLVGGRWLVDAVGAHNGSTHTTG
jgi:hypothetical protein